MNVKWQEKIPDTSILDRAGIPSIDSILMKTQIRWAGHIVRMPDHRLPKLLLYGQIKEGKRSQGGQKKRYQDTVKISLKAFGIKHIFWKILQEADLHGAWLSKKVQYHARHLELQQLSSEDRTERYRQTTCQQQLVSHAHTV